MKSTPVIASSILFAALCGCQQESRSGRETGDVPTEEAAVPEAAASTVPDEPAEEPKKSIIRADVGPEPTETATPETVHLVVPYPEKSARPDEAARSLIDGLLASPALQAGGAITIWGHSDSRGSDAENLSASRRRANAARDYLESKGVDAGRITVIALGEARPIAPNRKLDGSDDPEGRARNRRVEIEVAAPPPQDPAAQVP